MYGKKTKKKHISIWRRIGYHFIACAKICSIHGFSHIVRNRVNFYERLLWFLLVASATAWAIELALQAHNRYETRPTVTSLERDHWKWNTTFPAVTLCLDGIDNSKAENLMADLGIQEEQGNFKEFLNALVTTNFAAYMDLDKYMNLSLYDDVDKYLEWVLRINPTLDSPVIIAQTFGELQKFEEVMTELGVCFIYNSKIAIYSTPEYWSKHTRTPVNVNHTVMINPTITTPTLSINGLMTGYKIFFHGPDDIPDMSTNGLYVTPSTFSSFELSIDSVWTPSEVQDLKISQRECRFSDESDLKYSPVYSYNLCKSECRRNLCIKLCNCIPYYYRRLGNERICNISGMRCLYEHEVAIKHLTDNSSQVACSCIQNCNIDSITIRKAEVGYWFLPTALELKVIQYPTIRYKRSLIFSQANLLVQIGGVFGLFLGCSVLSLIELPYFLTLRFFWGVVKKRTI